MITVTASHPFVSRSSIARYARATARILFGLVFFGAGLTYFLGLVPNDPPPPGAAGDFVLGIAKSGYLLPLIKGTELICGLLLLSNRFVPLALVLIAPVVVNIFAVHTLLLPQGFAVAAVLVVLHMALTWSYRRSYAALLTARTE